VKNDLTKRGKKLDQQEIHHFTWLVLFIANLSPRYPVFDTKHLRWTKW